MLGTFYGTAHFQLLSGIYIGRQNEPYGPIFIFFTSSISAAAFICVSAKKIKERYKDRTFLQNINVQIKNHTTQYQYNNSKNNISLLNGYEMTLIVGIVFSKTLLVLVHALAIEDKIDDYWLKSVYLGRVSDIIYKVVIPIIFLTKRRDIQNFIKNTIFA